MTDRDPTRVEGRVEQGAVTTSGSDERSLGGLIGEMSTELSTLLRQEIELAKVEIKDEVGRAGKAGGMLGATAFAAYMALLLLSFAAAWGLDEVMPTGVAFVIVGVVYAAIAGVLYMRGRSELRKVNPVPEQTVETLKEDVAWAKQQTK